MPNLKTAKIISLLPSSPIRKLAPLEKEARKKGIKIYHLNIGDPDIKTPAVMIKALKEWKLNPVSYVNSQGLEELLDSLVWYYQKIGLDIDKNNLQITAGGSEAIFWALKAVANPGEEVLVFEPFYTNYNGFAILADVKLVAIKTSVDNGFHLPKIKEIEKKINKKTRAILLTNPNNPTGTVYTKEELENLVSLAQKHHLYLLSDETYREFCYDEKKAISLFSFAKKIPGQILVLDSLSKRYSLCGARVGCILTDNKILLDGFLKMAQARLCVGLIDQLMASKLKEVPEGYFKKNIAEYKKRRDLVVGELKKIKGVTTFLPEGAFYLIAKLPVKDSENFAKWLLKDFSDKKETIMLTPASGFYATPGLGKDEVRIAYVINRKDLLRAMEILKKALFLYKS